MSESKIHSLENINKKIYLIRNLVIIFCVTMLALGVSTIFWIKIEIVGLDIHKNSVSKYASGPAYRSINTHVGGKFTEISSEYSYKYKDKDYINNTTCFCLPIGISAEELNVSHAYIFPPIPSISVIKPGPDFILCGVLGLLALMFNALANILKAYIKKIEKLNNYGRLNEEGEKR